MYARRDNAITAYMNKWVSDWNTIDNIRFTGKTSPELQKRIARDAKALLESYRKYPGNEDHLAAILKQQITNVLANMVFNLTWLTPEHKNNISLEEYQSQLSILTLKYLTSIQDTIRENLTVNERRREIQQRLIDTAIANAKQHVLPEALQSANLINAYEIDLAEGKNRFYDIRNQIQELRLDINTERHRPGIFSNWELKVKQADFLGDLLKKFECIRPH